MLLPICLTMKKNNYPILFFIIFSLIFMGYHPGHAGEFIDYQGITGFYGQSDYTNIGPEPTEKYEWHNISYLIGKDFKPWLSLETLLGPGYIKTDGFDKTNSLEWRLLLDVHNKYLYSKLGTGVAYLFDSDNVPDLSNADFFAIVSFSTGFRFRFSKNEKNGPLLTLGYFVEHLSDPFKGGEDHDRGLNVGGIRGEFSWSF